MRQDLENIVNRLASAINNMAGTIYDKGGTVSGIKTLTQHVTAIETIPDFSHIMNGSETFIGNTRLIYIPECIGSQSFTSMYKFAKDCTALKKVARLYTDNVTTFVYAFYGCTALEQIDGILTESATTLGECFHHCSSLKRIVNPLDVSNIVSQMDTTFTGCSSLEELEFTGSLKADIWLSGAPKLTLASLQSVIDSLADLTDTGLSKKITFGAKNKAKLSAAQLATVTDKGWTLG